MLYVLTRGADIGTFEFGMIYFTTALPFLGSGIIVSLVISRPSSAWTAFTSSICSARPAVVSRWCCC